MWILKEAVLFDEILEFYEKEHRGWKGYSIGLEYLTAANERCQGRWTLVHLSGEDIANVMLPLHNHPIEVIPASGFSVSEAVQRLKQLPKDRIPDCWERICGIRDRDFSQMHIALEIENGILNHVDGVHRLLAYVLFEKNQEVRAYVAGVMSARLLCPGPPGFCLTSTNGRAGLVRNCTTTQMRNRDAHLRTELKAMRDRQLSARGSWQRLRIAM